MIIRNKFVTSSGYMVVAKEYHEKKNYPVAKVRGESGPGARSCASSAILLEYEGVALVLGQWFRRVPSGHVLSNVFDIVEVETIDQFVTRLAHPSQQEGAACTFWLSRSTIELTKKPCFVLYRKFWPPLN